MINESSEAQRKQEARNDFQESVADGLEEQPREQQAKRVFGTAKGYFFAVAATIIALGQFSEAVTLIEHGLDWTHSRFTNAVEYELISQVHVGNTEDYVTELLGSPQVSRAIKPKVSANYFYHEKFLLTVYLEDARVIAYTVAALRGDFQPTVAIIDGNDWLLQDSTYKSFPANPDSYMIDHSKIISYYLETLDNGRIGLFYNSYLGNITLTPLNDSHALLVDLYQNEVTGSDEEILKAQEQYRAEVSPNFFGMGTLALEDIQKGLLTAAEFTNYFGH